MLILIPMPMSTPINHYLFEGDCPHVGDIYMTFGTLQAGRAVSIIINLMDGERCFHRAMVAELSETDYTNTAVMSFNPKRVPTIRRILEKEFLCEWNGGAKFIEWRSLIGAEYEGDDENDDLYLSDFSVADTPLAVVFAAMGFKLVSPDKQPIADESSDLTEEPKETKLIDSTAFLEYIHGKEWKH